MKMHNKILKICIFIGLVTSLECCDSSGSWYKYYQLSNMSQRNIQIQLFYDGHASQEDGYVKIVKCDTIILNDGEKSKVFTEGFCPPEHIMYYLRTTDSIHIVVNNNIEKKYYISNWESERTPYNTDIYQTTKGSSKKQKEIFVYTFLPEDF